MDFEKGDYIVLTSGGKLMIQEVLGIETIKGKEFVILSGTYLSEDKKIIVEPQLGLEWPGTEYQYCIKKELVDRFKRMGEQEYVMEQARQHNCHVEINGFSIK